VISIILAAGRGTRMRPLSYVIPKILIPVRGKPVLDYLLDNLHEITIKHNYIVVSDQYESVQTYIDKTGTPNVSVVKGLGWETGGDLSIALQEVGTDDDAVVMNGDIITNVNMLDLYNFHRRSNAPVSMALFELNDEEEAKRFGQITLNADGSIEEFIEKNETAMRRSNLVNVGFYIFGKQFLNERKEFLVPHKFKLETELFPELARKHLLYGFPMDIRYWWDVGTMSSYMKAEHFFINERGIIPP
jgi:NDP-sugar pyrophosphorylase family protein